MIAGNIFDRLQIESSEFAARCRELRDCEKWQARTNHEFMAEKSALEEANKRSLLFVQWRDELAANGDCAVKALAQEQLEVLKLREMLTVSESKLAQLARLLWPLCLRR